MGEHNENPLSVAKKNGQQIVKVVDLGDDFGLVDIKLVPMFADEEKKTLAIGVVVVAGPTSRIAGITPVPVVIAEVGRITVEELRSSVARALQPPEQPA